MSKEIIKNGLCTPFGYLKLYKYDDIKKVNIPFYAEEIAYEYYSEANEKHLINLIKITLVCDGLKEKDHLIFGFEECNLKHDVDFDPDAILFAENESLIMGIGFEDIENAPYNCFDCSGLNFLRNSKEICNGCLYTIEYTPGTMYDNKYRDTYIECAAVWITKSNFKEPKEALWEILYQFVYMSEH